MLSPFGTGLLARVRKFRTCTRTQRMLGSLIANLPFGKITPNCFPMWLHQFTPLPAAYTQFCRCWGSCSERRTQRPDGRGRKKGTEAVGEPACPRTPAQLSQGGFQPPNIVFHHSKCTFALYSCFWHREPKSLGISKTQTADEAVFCYVNEATFGLHLRMGAGCPEPARD